MKKSIKLITILTPIATIGAIVPIAAINVISKGKHNDSKSPTAIKINASKTTTMDDMSKATTPLCFFSPEVYGSVGMWIDVPEASTVKLEYDWGEYNGTSISWRDEWEAISPGTTFKESMNHLTTIRFRAYNSTTKGEFSTSEAPIKFNIAGNSIYVGGSLLSLVCTEEPSGSTWESDLTLTQPYTFYQLFGSGSCGSIAEVGTNLLPFTTLTESCYQEMFANCYNLITAPALPASELKDSCYKGMFYYCSKLENAPYLPASKLATSCYEELFRCCYNLRNISLGYVGNFNNDSNNYFKNWVATHEDDTIEAVGKIYYNGLDTEKEVYAIPKNFAIVQNQDLITNKTIDITFNNDSKLGTQTTIVGSKNIVRVYNDATIGDVKSYSLPPVSRKSAGSDPLVLRNADGEVYGDDEKLVTTLTNKEAYLSYYKVPTPVDTTAVNIVSQYTAAEQEKNKYTVVTPSLQNGAWLQYKIDDGDWTTYTKQTGSIQLNHGENLQLKGNLNNTSTSKYSTIKITGKASLGGSAMSLWCEDQKEPVAPTTMKSYAFYKTFADSTGITSVSDTFLLPPGKSATDTIDLTPYCYNQMFSGCTSLTNAPVIPMKENISSATACCYRMFYKCESLEAAPDLPAKVLPNDSKNISGVYEQMFYGCTSMETGPEILPATVVYGRSYDSMFWECKSLDITEEQPIDILAVECKDGYENPYGSMAGMFCDCISLTKTPKIQNIEIVGEYSFEEMFYGCTSLIDASNITIGKSNVVLYFESLYKMFYGCTSLKSAPNLNNIKSTQEKYCYMCNNMFYKCTSLKIDTTQGDDGVEFFTCFTSGSSQNPEPGEDKDDNVFQMFPNKVTPIAGKTYYYHPNK